MKAGIHPEDVEVTAHCACGAKWQTRSTKKDVHLDICYNCHPFFTGRQKLIDTEGRVERFNKKFGDAVGRRHQGRGQGHQAKKTAAAKTH